MSLNVGLLREAIKDLPDETPIANGENGVITQFFSIDVARVNFATEEQEDEDEPGSDPDAVVAVVFD